MEIKAEKVTPYGSDKNKTAQVEEMFDNISPTYDFMNRLMTLGIDRSWRRRLVNGVASTAPRRILDVATGTGDLAISLAKANPQARVFGVDISEGMMEVGRKKVEAEHLADRVTLETADCLALPFADGSFDAVTAAFGVRNFEDLACGYREMVRVLTPGGTLNILELSVPPSPVVRPFYYLYTRGIIPLAGKLLTPDSRAYSYLPQSIAAMPQGEQMLALMEQCGLRDCRLHRLTFGAACIYTGVKV